MSGPVRRGGRCMPVADWPSADRLAWAEGVRPADHFDLVSRPALRWRARTLELVQNGYGRYLTWLDSQGLLDLDAGPAARVTRERARAYAADLAVTNGDYTVVARIAQLGRVLRILAPEQDWSWVLRGSERLRAGAAPVRDKRDRMQPTQAVMQLGHDLMGKADSDVHLTPVMRAKIYRDGLLIAFLVLRPIRGANLGSIALDQHLVETDAGWQLSFGAEETKHKRSMQMSWPEELVAQLACYLEQHRPVLLACAKRDRPSTNRLWISAHGTAMTYSAIALQVKARTKAALGTAINPHLFRSIVATDIATDTPERSRDVALVLGHATQATSERHYNLAGMLRANKKLQEVVEVKRQARVSKPRQPAGADHQTPYRLLS